MFHIMLQGAQVPDVKRTRLLRQADAAPLPLRLDLECTASKNSQGAMEQRGPAISVPTVFSLANSEELH